MRYWRSLYEILLFPIEVLVFAFALLGMGNLLTNSAFEYIIQIDSDFVLMLAECCTRVGSFLVVQFPFLFLLRLVTRKAGPAATILSAMAGYVTYLVVTMAFASSQFSSSAYSSILGISMSVSGTATMKAGIRYPLQTGILATIVVSVVTLNSYKASRKRNEYGVFSFLSRETYCVIRTCLLTGILALVVTYCWGYFLEGIDAVISFIVNDTTNPVNLAIYGVMDRCLSVLNLGTLIRSPFWYNSSGGSWISLAGTSVTGDVNIWTQQLAGNSLNSMAGRFITPYYILNLFAVPGMLWAIFSLQTDHIERRKTLPIYIFLTLLSLFTGCLLPIEIAILLLCPVLFFMHVACTGLLFGVCQSLQIYLGFQYSGTSTLTALPGTLLELLGYLQYSSLQETVVKVVITGLVCFFLYFLLTKFYFHFLALDLFHTGIKDTIVNGTIEAIGGLENIKTLHSSDKRLVIGLHDPTKIKVDKLLEIGAIRVTEVKSGFAIGFGAGSCMIRKAIQKRIKQSVRSER